MYSWPSLVTPLRAQLRYKTFLTFCEPPYGDSHPPICTNKKGLPKNRVTLSYWWRRLGSSRPSMGFTAFEHPALQSHPLHGFSSTTTSPNKKGQPLRLTLFIWWRRGESNPRPPVLCHWLYMLIPTFYLTGCYPPDGEDRQRFRCLFSAAAASEEPSRFYESDA